MRIISGFLKGKKINFIKNVTTRPLKDSVKENIFNILVHSSIIDVKLENSKVLDLYSGVGSFGIECLSRNADKVFFLENDINAASILKKNLQDLAIDNKTVVVNDNIEKSLPGILHEKFDIFFFDPPFLDKSFVNNLKLIKQKKAFSSQHIVIIHRERKTSDILNNLIKVIDTKHYGRSKIIFGLFI